MRWSPAHGWGAGDRPLPLPSPFRHDRLVIEPILPKAAIQGGVVRRDQLLELGVSARQIDRRLANGTWIPVIEGVYRILHLTSWRDRIAAAAAGLPNAVASHQSASRLLSFPMAQAGAVIVSVHTRTTHIWPGATVRRCADFSPSDITSVDRIPTTSPVRTLFDLAGVLPERAFVDLADTLASTGVITIPRLSRMAERLCRRGKTGSAAVRRYLEERGDGAAASPLETRAVALLRAAGLSPAVEYPIPWSPNERFDIAFPEERVAIELDSVQWHATPDRFQADRRRDREALLHDWKVLRFTWRDVEDQPSGMVAIVIRMLSKQT